MNKWWREYADKFDRLTLRERLMVFAAAALVVVFVIYAAAIEPPQQRRQQLASQMQSQREETAALQTQREKLTGAAAPDASVVARRDALAKRIAESDEALRTLHKSLVPAQRMNLVLQEMLRADPGLQLVSLRTIAAVPLLPDTPKAAPSETPPGTPPGTPPKGAFIESNVYKHGVEITLRGGYEQLYSYLARLERTEWRMFWSRARLTTEDHPRLTLTLTIYTLSLDKAWLEV
jgi:MSHA biogenesis protein MshJ